MTECSIKTCHREAESRGWCHAHYMRWYQTGDVRADVPLKDTRPRSAEELFASNTEWGPAVSEELGPCLLWTWRKNRSGYGVLSAGGEDVLAHRWSYERSVGPIPEGLEPDHRCRVPACVRPEHLEPVTHRENVLRGVSAVAENARKTHCSNGHEFTPENTFKRGRNGRGCRQCNREKCQAAYQKRKAREGITA